MEFSQIKELMRLFSESDLDRLNLKTDTFSFKLVRGGSGSVEVAAGPVVPASMTPPAEQEITSEAALEDESLHWVNSPIVGTYYSAPNPKADAFVRVGDQVTAGQTLCIVEAMKLMNEIQSEVSGEIVHIQLENAQPVEYGQRLFAIRPVG